MTRVSHGIDRIDATFDNPGLVANAGLLLIATLTQRLGLEALIDATVRLIGRVGGARPGRKALTLVHAMIAGASHIDHADMLRAGSTASVLRPSGDGPFDAGHVPAGLHVRSCPPARGCRRSGVGAGVGAGRRPRRRALVIDIDSTICEVDGKHKQGAGFGYTHVLGSHPMLATRADSGEVLHAGMRKGQANTQRGARRFIDELVARVRRAGATGQLTMRMDSGFWSNDTITTLKRLDVRYTMAVRTNTTGIAAAIAQIPDDAWVEIEYTPMVEAQVAEMRLHHRQRTATSDLRHLSHRSVRRPDRVTTPS